MKRWNFCTQHPFSVLISWLGLALLGICSLCKLEVGFYPEISIPYATIITEYPALPADEVEKLVTIPLENSISAVKNVRQISSSSKRGESIIRLEFNWGADMAVIGSDIRNKIDEVYPFLPEAASRPVLSFKMFSDSIAMALAVYPKPGFSLTQASSLVKKELKSRLLSLDGVAQVQLLGCTEPEIQVNVSYPVLLSVPSLDLQHVASAIKRSLFRYPIGNVEEGEHQYSMRAETDIRNLDNLKHIPLDKEGAMTVADVAEVGLGEKEQVSCFRCNGKEGIGLTVIKTGGSSLLHTCKELNKTVNQLSQIYGSLFDIAIIEDNSKPLYQAIMSLVITIGAGIVCACIVIMILMQNRYVALIIILALPFSLLPVFVFMHCLGMSLNIITLSALAVGSGMTFDNAVVVTEQLMRKQTYVSCTPAVISSTLTTIIIFVPVILLPGVMGKIFSSLAITVILYLSVSCVMSLTLTPALFILMKKRKQYDWKTFILEKKYEQYLGFMKSRKRTLSIIVAAVLLPLCLMFFIPFKIIPEIKSDSLEIQISFPYGYPFSAYIAWASEMEDKIRKSSLCSDISIHGGYDRDSQQDFNTFIFRMRSAKKKDLISLFDSSPWEYKVQQEKIFLSKLVGNDNLYAVTSSDRATLERKVSIIEEKARKDNVSTTIIHGVMNYPEYRISLSKNIYSVGLTPEDIFNTIAVSSEGIVVSQLEMDGEQVDIRVRYGKEFVDTPEKIASVQFKEKDRILFAQSFIQLRKEQNYFALDRLNRQNALFLTFSPDLNNGYGATRISETMTRAHQKEILVLFIGALGFIWFVLAIQFESCIIPLFILCTVPLGLSGSLLALFVAGKSLNISSVLGLIILSGTGVNSGILILSDVVRGISVGHAALSRLRTVCLTLFSTVAALLPVALFDSNPIQNNASISLLGGLVFGTAALFALIPAFIKEDCHEQ